MNYVSKTSGFDDPNAVLYSCDDDAESISSSDPEDAIDSALDRWLEPKVSVLEHLKSAVGDTITVYAFKRMKLGKRPTSEDILERVYEELDEEYGDPDQASEPTPTVEAAAEALCALIRAEYVPWACECCGSAVVNVEAFVREKHPDWLEPEAQRVEQVEEQS